MQEVSSWQNGAIIDFASPVDKVFDTPSEEVLSAPGGLLNEGGSDEDCFHEVRDESDDESL